MLLNSLFIAEQLAEGDFSIETVVRIDRNHPIFEGHFPGSPVVPGVCMLQLIKELLEQSANRKLRIQTASNIKFLAVIDPTIHERINASILIEHRTETELKITASLFAGDITFFKLKAALKPA